MLMFTTNVAFLKTYTILYTYVQTNTIVYNMLPCNCLLMRAVMPGPSPDFFTISIGLSSVSSKPLARCPLWLLAADIVSLTCHKCQCAKAKACDVWLLDIYTYLNVT